MTISEQLECVNLRIKQLQDLAITDVRMIEMFNLVQLKEDLEKQLERESK